MPVHDHDPSDPDYSFIARKAGAAHADFSTTGAFQMDEFAATDTAGSGNAHNNTQPTYFTNYFIFTGN